MTAWNEIAYRYRAADLGVICVLKDDETTLAGRITNLDVTCEVCIIFIADGKTVSLRLDPAQSLAERTPNCFHSSRGIGGGITNIGYLSVVLVSQPCVVPRPQLTLGWGYPLGDEPNTDEYSDGPEQQQIRLND